MNKLQVFYLPIHSQMYWKNILKFIDEYIEDLINNEY